MGGSNKPHSIARVDAKGITGAFERAMLEHEPASLLGRELELDRATRSIPPQPVPVFAWVRYGAIPVLVAARMVQFTDTACAIRWITPTGVEHRAWVWSGSVRTRPPEKDLGRLATPAQVGRELNEIAAREVTARTSGRGPALGPR